MRQNSCLKERYMPHGRPTFLLVGLRPNLPWCWLAGAIVHLELSAHLEDGWLRVPIPPTFLLVGGLGWCLGLCAVPGRSSLQCRPSGKLQLAVHNVCLVLYIRPGGGGGLRRGTP